LVSIVENWTDLKGTVQAQEGGDLPGFVTATVAVEETRPVEGFRNLLSDATGTSLRVLVPESLASAQGISTGSQIEARVRRGSPEHVFVHPDRFEASDPS
jgi:hypothetical protein